MDPQASGAAVCVSPSANPRSAWDEMIVRFRGQLRGRVRRTLQRAGLRTPHDEVDELTQDVCCRLLDRGERKLRAFRGHSDGEIGAYLGRAAERIVLDQLRALRAQKRGGRTILVAIGDDSEQVADDAATPEERLLAAEERQRLLALCGSPFGAEHSVGRRVLELALLGGWSSAEIARQVGGGISVRAVERLLREARRRLRTARPTG
jgi:RNA polymerase sigma factor (sigma-70 family)